MICYQWIYFNRHIVATSAIVDHVSSQRTIFKIVITSDGVQHEEMHETFFSVQFNRTAVITVVRPLSINSDETTPR